MAKFENPKKSKVINNSYFETIKEFVDSNDFKKMKGKVIFFNTWATWCGSCFNEISILEKIYLANKNNPNLVFVSYCSDLNSNLIQNFLIKYDLQLHFIFLNSKQGLRSSLRTLVSIKNPQYGIDPSIDAIPMNLIISSDDKLLYFNRGAIENADLNSINAILAASCVNPTSSFKSY